MQSLQPCQAHRDSLPLRPLHKLFPGPCLCLLPSFPPLINSLASSWWSSDTVAAVPCTTMVQYATRTVAPWHLKMIGDFPVVLQHLPHCQAHSSCERSWQGAGYQKSQPVQIPFTCSSLWACLVDVSVLLERHSHSRPAQTVRPLYPWTVMKFN